MNATETLSREHEVIKKILSALEVMAGRVESGGKLDAVSARDAVDFLRDFADRCHHAKEEGLLFPALEERGFSSQAGPTAVMRQEHVLGRGLTAAMGKAMEAVEKGDAGAARDFAGSAREYVALLRSHIDKENGILFPMAAQMLGEKGNLELAGRFDTVEHDDIGPGVHEKYLAVAERLERELPSS